MNFINYANKRGWFLTTKNNLKNNNKYNQNYAIYMCDYVGKMDILSQEYLLWPFYSINVVVPKAARKGINIFEETILDLISIGYTDSAIISDIVMLDEELINFIKNRLLHQKYINDDYEVSELGVKMLANCDEEELPKEYQSLTFFVDAVSGKLMAFYLSDDYPKYSISLNNKNKKENVYDIHIEQLQRYKEPEKATLIPPVISQDCIEAIKPLDILSAIEKFNKRMTNRTLANIKVINKITTVRTEKYISINKNPTLVFAVGIIAIQRGNSEIIVGTGIEDDFSQRAVTYLKEIDLNLLGKLRRSSLEGIDSSHQAKKEHENLSLKYPNITECMSKVYDTYKAVSQSSEITNTHQANDAKNKIENEVANIYMALEYGFEIAKDKFDNNWQLILDPKDFKRNKQLLVEKAHKIGFNVDQNDNFSFLLSPKYGAIVHNSIDMVTVLSLNVIAADFSLQHPFNRLAKLQPDMFKFIGEINRIRNAVKHGDTQQLNINAVQLREYLNQTLQILMFIIPDFVQDYQKINQLPMSKVDNSRYITEERNLVRVFLEKKFGIILYDKFNQNIKEQLIRAELFFVKKTAMVNAIEIVTAYASLLQIWLQINMQQKYFIKNKSHRMDSRESIATLDKLVTVGFYPSKEQIPDVLAKISGNRVDSALKGFSSTLGAQLRAFIYSIEIKALKNSYPTYKKLIDLVCLLSDLRGHGNNVLEISENKLVSLKDDVLETLKQLGEIHE